jgi:hypothetical protein
MKKAEVFLKEIEQEKAGRVEAIKKSAENWISKKSTSIESDLKSVGESHHTFAPITQPYSREEVVEIARMLRELGYGAIAEPHSLAKHTTYLMITLPGFKKF